MVEISFFCPLNVPRPERYSEAATVSSCDCITNSHNNVVEMEFRSHRQSLNLRALHSRLRARTTLHKISAIKIKYFWFISSMVSHNRRSHFRNCTQPRVNTETKKKTGKFQVIFGEIFKRVKVQDGDGGFVWITLIPSRIPNYILSNSMGSASMHACNHGTHTHNIEMISRKHRMRGVWDGDKNRFGAMWSSLSEATRSLSQS